MDRRLGRIEPVDLQEVWASEAGGFTPWLAKQENLDLLGEAIELDLELEQTEAFVGPFRADIVCRELTTGTEGRVVVENQLEATDHRHLGQILTYAAGLKATNMVWIARRFTDAHRAALDMLNACTVEDFRFFGVEIELWRIGASEPAPRFNVVCKPNDWVKPPQAEVEPKGAKSLQLDYWDALMKHIAASRSRLRVTKPLPQNWMNFSIGRMHAKLVTTLNTQQNRIGVQLGLYGARAKANFGRLAEERTRIEQEFGGELLWELLPGRKESRIALRRESCDPANRAAWPEQHEWMRRSLEKLDQVFRERIRSLPDGEPEGLADQDGADTG